VEPGHPKKFGTVFFEDCLRLLGGLDHFLGLVAFKTRKLRDRHTKFLPWFGLLDERSQGALGRYATFFTLAVQAQAGKVMSRTISLSSALQIHNLPLGGGSVVD
jgi:hypothetical protein